MQLLYLAHRVPFPPNKGDKIRAFHELRALALRGHDVHLFAFADDPADLHRHADLAKFCKSVTILPLTRIGAARGAFKALVAGQSLSVGYYEAASMHAAVRTCMRDVRPQAAIVFSSTMAQYVPEQLRGQTVVDLVDVDSAKWSEYATYHRFPKSMIYRVEGRRLQAYERSVLEDFPHVVLTSSREAELLAAGRATADIHALVNGVDTDYFVPAALRMDGASEIVFVGAMDYFPNVDGVQWFADEVWPLLRGKARRFTIVGSRPSKSVRALAGRDGIEVTGAVPDVRPYLQRASVVAVPLRIARGVQNKVLEAMAVATAVVATPPAVAAFENQETLPVHVASTAPEFAHALANLLADSQERRDLGNAARAYVIAHHRWETMLDRFCELVEACGGASRCA